MVIVDVTAANNELELHHEGGAYCQGLGLHEPLLGVTGGTTDGGGGGGGGREHQRVVTTT